MKNKSLSITITILIIALSSMAQLKGTFTDSRDGKTYKTVKIGEQTWMAENLAWKADSYYWAADDDVSNVAKYGYLYSWETAQTVSPPGWHLPDKTEWTILIDYLGGPDVAANKMRATSGWRDYYNHESNYGTNVSGFTALPGGGHSLKSRESTGYWGYWWSSTRNGEGRVWLLDIDDRDPTVYRDFEEINTSIGLSVRCVRD